MSPAAVRTALSAACILDGIAIAAVLTGHDRLAAAALAAVNLIIIRAIAAHCFRKPEER